MLELPTEIIFMILEYLYRIDLQLLRKVNIYFSGIIPFRRIDIRDEKMNVVHLQNYRKMFFVQPFLFQDVIRTCLKYSLFDSLVYLRKFGFCEGEDLKTIVSISAKNGNLDYMELLHKAGFPWTLITVEHAATYGHIKCVKYAIENGCPYDKDILTLRMPNEILEYLRSLIL